MNKRIKVAVDNCEECQLVRPIQPKEPLQHFPEATEPMESISCDLFDYAGKTYLVTVDRYSGYPFVNELRNLDTAAVIRALRSIWHVHGYPRVIVTDNGPQFRSDFAQHCKSIGARHFTSSPYHSQSNGLAEAAVKNCKQLMQKVGSKKEDFDYQLFKYRNTPRASKDKSPAELFTGRIQRTNLPTLAPPLQVVKAVAGLPQFTVGSKVRVYNVHNKKWDICGEIVDVRPSGRSYQIMTEDLKIIVRNRRFVKADLRTAGEEIPDLTTTDESEDDFPRPQPQQQPPNGNPAIHGARPKVRQPRRRQQIPQTMNAPRRSDRIRNRKKK